MNIKLIIIHLFNEHEFMIKYKHSSGNSTINLGFMIVEGSETVTLNGIVLSRGVDYTIDYFSGTLNLLNLDAMLPGADINITYEENELISFDQKLLFGTHLKYGFDSQNFISGGLFFYNQTTLEDNVDIGGEPMRNFIWNINGRYESDLNRLTKIIDRIPLINATAPSSISIEGEFAEVYPNPNPLGQAFLILKNKPKNKISFLRKKIGKLNYKYLNSINLHSEEISTYSSIIAKQKRIRLILKEYQKKFAKKFNKIAIEGRDISTKILNKNPRYDIAFFFKCNLNTAAYRRWKDLKRSNKHITLSEVKKSLKKRNQLDVKRRFSPLIQTKDSIIIRTDILNKKGMVIKMSKEIEKKLLLKYGRNYKTGQK